MQKHELGESQMPPVDERVEIFATGIGDIQPTGEYTLEQVVEASDRVQEQVEDAHVVCVDGRPATEKQPVREKVAGGNLYTFLFAAVAAGWNGFSNEAKTNGPGSMVEEAANFLVQTKEFLGAHWDNCGAVNKATEITAACAEYGEDDQWVAQAQRHLGENFNAEHWRSAKEGYAQIATDEQWQTWDANQIQQTVNAKGGVVEQLKGDNTRPDLDPENKRHGHFEEATRVNAVAGTSNDRDNSEIQTFQADVAPMVRMAQKAAASDEDFSRILHAEVMRQFGTLYVLSKNQPVF